MGLQSNAPPSSLWLIHDYACASYTNQYEPMLAPVLKDSETYREVLKLLEAILNGLVNVLYTVMCERPSNQAEADTKDKKA